MVQKVCGIRGKIGNPSEKAKGAEKTKMAFAEKLPDREQAGISYSRWTEADVNEGFYLHREK